VWQTLNFKLFTKKIVSTLKGQSILKGVDMLKNWGTWSIVLYWQNPPSQYWLSSVQFEVISLCSHRFENGKRLDMYLDENVSKVERTLMCSCTLNQTYRVTPHNKMLVLFRFDISATWLRRPPSLAIVISFSANSVSAFILLEDP
jgi:hypothetical protein